MQNAKKTLCIEFEIGFVKNALHSLRNYLGTKRDTIKERNRFSYKSKEKGAPVNFLVYFLLLSIFRLSLNVCPMYNIYWQVIQFYIRWNGGRNYLINNSKETKKDKNTVIIYE